MIILSLLTPSNLRADDTALKLCDEALVSCEFSNREKIKLIDAQEELIKKLALQRNEAFDRLADEGSSTPWYLMIIIGIAGGVILSNTVLSK